LMLRARGSSTDCLDVMTPHTPLVEHPELDAVCDI
jgi:hypothetical protein